MEKLHIKTKNLFANISGERKTEMPYHGMLLFSSLPIKRTVLLTDWGETVGDVSLLVARQVLPERRHNRQLSKVSFRKLNRPKEARNGEQ